MERGNQPRQLANTTTLASSDNGRIPQMSDLWALPPVQSGQDRRRASPYRGVLWAACAAQESPRPWRGMGHRTGAMRTSENTTSSTLVNKARTASVLATYAIVIYVTQGERDSFSHTTTKGGVGMRHLSATMSAKNTLWMCVALAAAILAACLVVVLGTPTKRAEAAFPGKNGKIAFVSRPSTPARRSSR